MKYKIVFSIPIHEKLEVAVDQVLNFMHFNPDCAIIFHISEGFNTANTLISEDSFIRIIKSIGNVWINPNRLRTGRCDIIQTHISNYKYLSEIIDFEYFGICASNELFIKPGLYERVAGFDALVQNERLIDTSCIFKESVFKDPDLAKYIVKYNVDIWYSHIEGQLYKRELFGVIVDEICSFYNYLEMPFPYPREEVYFSTVVKTLKNNDLSFASR